MSTDSETTHDIASGLMDDEMTPFVPGINCYTCGRFVGRDGSIEIEHYEMSEIVASVEGECRRCLDAPSPAPSPSTGDRS